MEEYFYTCPHCFSQVSVFVDLTISEQDYVEDCERCCNPIHFYFECDGEKVTSYNLGEVN